MATRAGKDDKRGIGVFKTRREAEQALYQLRDRGFDLERISVIAPDSDPKSKDAEVDVYTHSQGNHADSGAVSGAIAGGTLGTITGLLVGLGAAAIPGIGPILLAGAEATALATTLAGTAIGTASGGIIGALIGLGVPEDQAKVYNERLSEGQYIILVTGTPRTVEQIGDLLRDLGIEEWHVYDALQVEVTPTVDDVVSPAVVEPQEKVAPPHREREWEVVQQKRSEVIEPDQRTIVTPRVETERRVEVEPQPQVKREVVQQKRPEVIQRDDRTPLPPRPETEHRVKSERQPEVIEQKKIERGEKVVPSNSRADLKKDNLKKIDGKKVSDHPEVIVIDNRDEKYKHL